jgi:hypothetical protein
MIKDLVMMMILFAPSMELMAFLYKKFLKGVLKALLVQELLKEKCTSKHLEEVE